MTTQEDFFHSSLASFFIIIVNGNISNKRKQTDRSKSLRALVTKNI
jgi:hypothetical protein